MNSSLPHSLKSTESSSYEIMFSILDCIDAINEANKKLDHAEGNEEELLNSIFSNLDTIAVEMRSLVQYWLIIKQRYLRAKQAKQSV
jgi:hypothetical protein